MVTKRLMKTTWYPRPHNMTLDWKVSIESGTPTETVAVPAVMYDEGLGAPSGYSANNENASFVPATMPNCYPESKIEHITCFLTMSLTKASLETDKVPNTKVGFMVINTSFGDEIDAKDELTGATIKTILELTKESTDRQCYPLWAGTKVTELYTNSDYMHANVPGLTTDQGLENVAFDLDTYYDALQYYSISDKLKKVQRGIKWITLNRNHMHQTFKIHISSKNKFMNEYNYMGLLCITPQNSTAYQYGTVADTTADQKHVEWKLITRYNEWNENFDMERV